MPHPQQEIEMKIKITSDKNPWANGSPCAKGQEIELDDETGKILVEAGMALEIGASKPKRARTKTKKFIFVVVKNLRTSPFVMEVTIT